jgi:hypothetical protein
LKQAIGPVAWPRVEAACMPLAESGRVAGCTYCCRLRRRVAGDGRSGALLLAAPRTEHFGVTVGPAMSHGRSPCPLGTPNCHTSNGLGGLDGFASPRSLGLGAWDDTQALREWIQSASTGPKAASVQDQARAVVQAFAARVGGGVFIHIARADVANGLLVRVEHPDRISQGDSSLCGPAALIFNLASRDPVAYVRFVIGLYENGTATLNRLRVSPGSDLRGYDVKARLDPADWIPLASLRDSENWFFDYQAVDNAFAGITLPSHLESWFKKIGFSEVINDTNLVLTKDQKNIEEAARLYGEDFWVCLLVNGQMLASNSQAARSLTPDHWIVLTSDVKFSSGNISLTVFTWGARGGHYPIPVKSAKPLPVSDFLANYYGYVAARH